MFSESIRLSDVVEALHYREGNTAETRAGIAFRGDLDALEVETYALAQAALEDALAEGHLNIDQPVHLAELLASHDVTVVWRGTPPAGVDLDAFFGVPVTVETEGEAA